MAFGPSKFSPSCSGSVELARDRGVAAQVVVADRLLEPGHAFGLQRAAARQRLGDATSAWL